MSPNLVGVSRKPRSRGVAFWRRHIAGTRSDRLLPKTTLGSVVCLRHQDDSVSSCASGGSGGGWGVDAASAVMTGNG